MSTLAGEKRGFTSWALPFVPDQTTLIDIPACLPPLARANEGCRHQPNQLIRQGLRQVFRQISLTFLRGALAQNTASFYLSSLLLGNPLVL